LAKASRIQQLGDGSLQNSAQASRRRNQVVSLTDTFTVTRDAAANVSVYPVAFCFGEHSAISLSVKLVDPSLEVFYAVREKIA